LKGQGSCSGRSHWLLLLEKELIILFDFLNIVLVYFLGLETYFIKNATLNRKVFERALIKT